jgi:putative hemolysin
MSIAARPNPPSGLFRLPRPSKVNNPLRVALIDWAERLLGLRILSSLYDALPAGQSHGEFAEQALRKLNVSYQIDGTQPQGLPKLGPCVVVANHPFGGLEGLLIIKLLLSVRDDVKVLGNELLACVPQLKDLLFPIDLFSQRADAVAANGIALRRALRWLQDGHLLVVFPSGEVSHLLGLRKGIADPAWNPAVGSLVRRSEASVCPVYFDGVNSLTFQMLGLIHPVLRTMMLARELINKRNRQFRIVVGKPIAYSRLRNFCENRELTEYLRHRTYLLKALRRPAQRTGQSAGQMRDEQRHRSVR